MGSVPPAAIALSGEFSGVVFTAPASQWPRTDTVGHWPPTADAAGPFRAWEASLAAGTLVSLLMCGWLGLLGILNSCITLCLPAYCCL